VSNVITQARTQDAVNLHMNGFGVQRIADTLGLSRQHVWRLLNSPFAKELIDGAIAYRNARIRDRVLSLVEDSLGVYERALHDEAVPLRDKLRVSERVT